MRHHAAIFVSLLLFVSVAAGAGTITSISPNSINVASAEHFVTVYGSSLGSQIIFDGPAGTFTLNVNASTASYVVAWVPLEVVNHAGTYTVTSTGSGGQSNSVNLTVVGPKNRFVLVMPEYLFVSALSREGAYAKYDVSWWSPEKDPTPPGIECIPSSGSFFRFGTTRVDCTGTNYWGERDSASFTVNVIDDVSPAVSVPRDIVAEQTEEGGAIVKFEADASDAIDGVLPVSCDHSSGTLFPVGVTRVTCTAMDLSLNPGTETFLVEVRGKSRLTLRMPMNLVVDADSAEGARVDYVVEAWGTEDPEPAIKCDPPSGSNFRMGETVVSCVAEDRFGQSAEGQFTLSVVDTMGPVVHQLYTTPEYLVPLDGGMRPVEVVAGAVDLVDPFPRCTITGITANEPISPEDWKIASDREVALRATVGGRSDRIYYIALSCTDANRNESTATAAVVVPASGEAPKPGPSSVTTPSAAPGRRRAGGT